MPVCCYLPFCGMIYLDYNATTPVDPAVLERMLPYFSERFGNPSSAAHAMGWTAEAAVDRGAGQLAELLSCNAGDLVFTSGATEAINHAIKGVASVRGKDAHLITVATEHMAVLDCFASLAADGWRTTVLPVNGDGMIDLDLLRDSIANDTALIATMWANNEIGVIHPIAKIAEIAHVADVPLFVDATQAVGKIPVSVEGIDLLACSAHKFYGPKGVGALYVRRGRGAVRLKRFVDGGSQQRLQRGGTLNVPGIVGIGQAAQIAAERLSDEKNRLESLRDRLEKKLLSACDGAFVNGSGAPRLPQTLSITFPGAPAESMLLRLRDLALSTASACSSGSATPSHVLTAIGLSPEDAGATFRISLGRPTTESEVDAAAEQLIEAWRAATQSAGKQVGIGAGLKESDAERQWDARATDRVSPLNPL